MNPLAVLIWRKPIPVWNDMVLGARSLIQTYRVCNTTEHPIVIQSIDFYPATDERVRFAGGSCVPGLHLPARTCSTIHVEITPNTLGMVNQELRVYYAGIGSPLKSRIALSISKQKGRFTSDGKKADSYLVDDTRRMARQQRLIEQEGHRRLARLHAREHRLEETAQQHVAAEGALQNSILENPWLNSQRFDGIDPNLNPEPPLNSEARREFDNERREQEMEKQLRLGNMPKFSTAPKPQGQF